MLAELASNATALLSLALVSLTAGTPDRQYAQPDAPEGWQHDSMARVTRYIVQGSPAYGHTFGFAKLAGHCAQDVLWLTWTSAHPDVHKGDTVPVRFSAGSEAVALDLSVTDIHEAPRAGKDRYRSGTVLLFTNRALTDDLLWLLTARQGNVRVTAEGIQDAFPVQGFSAARARAGAECVWLQ